MDAMNKFTVLAGPTQGFGRDAAGSQTSDAGRQGECRGWIGLRYRRFVSILCQSLLVSLSWRHLLLTCKPLETLVFARKTACKSFLVKGLQGESRTENPCVAGSPLVSRVSRYSSDPQ